jgi:phenylalanyl-tRNA synthetase beta chain
MQTSTFPRLLEHAGENMLSVSETLRAFTCAHVFSKTQGEWLECGMIVAERRGSSLLETPFLELKQFILDEFRGSGLSIEVRATEKIPFGHPGRSADIVVGGKAMGMVFEVHPQISAAFDLPGRAAAALLDLTSIFALPIEVAIFRPLPQFPAIVYDLTVTLDSSQSADSVLRKIHQSSSLLEDVQVADLYDGAPLKKGQYNLTVRCTYRAKDRTLTEEEIKKEHERLEKLATAV